MHLVFFEISTTKSLREPLAILATWAIPVTWATAVAFLPSRSPSRWRHLWEALVAQATPAVWGPYLEGKQGKGGEFWPRQKHWRYHGIQTSQIWQKFCDGTRVQRRSRKKGWKEDDSRPCLLTVTNLSISLITSYITYHLSCHLSSSLWSQAAWNEVQIHGRCVKHHGPG